MGRTRIDGKGIGCSGGGVKGSRGGPEKTKISRSEIKHCRHYRYPKRAKHPHHKTERNATRNAEINGQSHDERKERTK